MGRTIKTERRRIKTDWGHMKVLILRPTKQKEQVREVPAVLWIHGGGYATGMAEMVFMSRALPLVKKYGAVVLSPAYRLSGEAAYPAALEDCYQALLYLREHCKELGCNPAQIMVGGESAGGGLTAALCIMARDRGEVNIAFQMPLYPMLDDRDTYSSANNHGLSWNTRRNHAAWNRYLRGLDRNSIPSTAVPARLADYSRLPPAYTFVGDREAFYCETLSYINQLKREGIWAEADVYHSGFHAFDMLLPFLKKSRQAAAKFEAAFAYAMEHFQAAQPECSEKQCGLLL